MLKKLLNQATLELTIEAQGPLLIKSGIEGGADPSVPDMQFVRSGGQVYIPGSSLKGVFRSYAEKIARTVGARCCNPFDNDDKSPDCFCGKRLENQRESNTVYKQSCHICRLFGSTAMASRIKFNDAYSLNGEIPNTETRTSVAIDRILGSVAQGPFDFEVVTTATFKTSIHMRNFELWQMGLLALVLRDLEEGLIPVGCGKSRGLGEVTAKVTAFDVRYLGALQDSDQAMLPDGRSLGDMRTTLFGIGALATDSEREAYAVSSNDRASIRVDGTLNAAYLGVCISFDAAARREIFRQCVNERWKEIVHHDRSRNSDTK